MPLAPPVTITFFPENLIYPLPISREPTLTNRTVLVWCRLARSGTEATDGSGKHFT
jgi:hypothetical protein